jgi:hypothetical protein
MANFSFTCTLAVNDAAEPALNPAYERADARVDWFTSHITRNGRMT